MNRDTEARGLMRFHTGFGMPNSTPRLSQIPRLLMLMLLRLHLFEESISVLLAFFGGKDLFPKVVQFVQKLCGRCRDGV